jgi:hypothetical protein
MKKILLFLLICINSVGYTQIKDISFTLSPNYTLINNVEKRYRLVIISPTPPDNTTRVPYATIKETYHNKPGLNLAVNFQAAEMGKFFIRSGLAIQYQRFQRTVQSEQTNDPFNLYVPVVNGRPIYSIYGYQYSRDPDGNIIVDSSGQPILIEYKPNPDLGKTSTIYVQLPITLGGRFFSDKIRTSIGFSTAYLLYAESVKEKRNVPESTYKDVSVSGYNSILLNGVFEASYSISNHLGVQLSYIHSFTPIYEKNHQYAGKTYYHVISFGLSYQLKNGTDN